MRERERRPVREGETRERPRETIVARPHAITHAHLRAQNGARFSCGVCRRFEHGVRGLCSWAMFLRKASHTVERPGRVHARHVAWTSWTTLDEDEDLDPTVVLTAIEVVNDDSNCSATVAPRAGGGAVRCVDGGIARIGVAPTANRPTAFRSKPRNTTSSSSRHAASASSATASSASRARSAAVRKLGVDTHREAMESSVAALKSTTAAHGRTWAGGVRALCEEVKTFHARLKAQEARAYETNVLSTYTLGVLSPSKLAVALWTQDLASVRDDPGRAQRGPSGTRSTWASSPQEAGLQYTLAVAPGSVTTLNASTLSPSLRKVFNGRAASACAVPLGAARASRRPGHARSHRGVQVRVRGGGGVPSRRLAADGARDRVAGRRAARGRVWDAALWRVARAARCLHLSTRRCRRRAEAVDPHRRRDAGTGRRLADATRSKEGIDPGGLARGARRTQLR